jgi:Cu(I)/Ag(I) efflux system membrane protein CusA/SilA
VGTTIEGRRRFPIRVRLAEQYRRDARALGEIPIGAHDGSQIPLNLAAKITEETGPAMISSENGLLQVSVLLSVRGRDIGGFVEEAKRITRQRVNLPPGYYLGWSGQYENQEHARKRLQIVLPIVLGVIYILLFLTYRSFVEAAHVLLAVPFALTGGVYLLYLLKFNMSVAVWVGFIALFGTAVQTGMIMVMYLNEAVAQKRLERGDALTLADLREAVMEGAMLRLRPKVMTVATIVAGLLPLMWSQRVGAEVVKPLATPVLGGMVSSMLHVLVVTPVIFLWLREREFLKKERMKPIR